jgi:HTH-type transcriptional regulator, SHP2-responsive activator
MPFNSFHIVELILNAGGIRMNNYGATLRVIRKQKGLSMKELSDGICSVSFLSKFEREDSDITLGLFTRILEKLMMSIDEFLYIHNNYQTNLLEQFFKDVSIAYNKRDSAKLKALKELEMKKWQQLQVNTYYYNVLLIQVYEMIVDRKALDGDVKEEDIRLLSEYLFRVEVWGYYEFMLYNATLLFLQPAMVVQLSRTAYDKSNRYRNYKKVNDVIITIMMNTIVYLLGPVNHFNRKLESQAEVIEFFSYLETLAMPETHLFERVSLLYLHGSFELKSGNEDVGLAKFQQAIQILTDLGSNRFATHVEQYLEQIVEHMGI